MGDLSIFYRKRGRIRHKVRVLDSVRSVVELSDLGYRGLVSFPVYGERGLGLIEKLRRLSLRWYGDCSCISIIKAFYKVIDSFDESEMTDGRLYNVLEKRGSLAEESNWEVAR